MTCFICSIVETLDDAQNWSVNNILTAISIILAIIGGFFAYTQWRFSNQTNRIELLNRIIEKLRFDEDMAGTMNLIDYGEPWYDEDFHNGGGDLELKIDRLFSFLDYICYLCKEKRLGAHEFDVLLYEVHRVCTSYQAQNYLWNLYHFSVAQNTMCSFQNLIDYGLKQGDINPDIFKDPSPNYYRKYLNF